MVLVRALLPELTPDAARKAREKPRARMLTGYSHRRFVVHNAMTSQNYYDVELRPVLEHLLAARLAERHAINLYQDPEKARAGCCAAPRATTACGAGSTPPAECPGRGRWPRHPAEAPSRAWSETGATMSCPNSTSYPERSRGDLLGQVLDEIERAVVGRRRTLELVLIGVLAGGHVLLEDLPGLGKTLIARSFAKVLASISPASSSPRTCCPLTWSAPRSTTSGRARWSSARGRSSPSCCWPTRSTGPRPRPRPRCWRRWARAR